MGDIEVAAIIGPNNRIIKIYLGIPGYVPDSHERWLDIWNNRSDLYEIAHTHPKGALGFSEEDRTTRVAIEKGLGRGCRWSVITEDSYLVHLWEGAEYVEEEEPWWVDILRCLSYE